jgi:putative ABC transport system ATP-binding protein
VLKTNQLGYQYPNNKLLVFPDIEIPDSSNCLILGESGCGKTTLLHLLAGLRTPTQGNIWYNDTDITALANHQKDNFRGKNIGVVFQSSAFIQSLSVLENLMMPLFLSHQVQDENKALQLLKKVNLEHKIRKPISALSVGEQQRVSILRAIMHQPKWLFADEPTSALDNTNATRVIDLMIEVAAENKSSLIVVTHDHRWNNAISHTIQL